VEHGLVVEVPGMLPPLKGEAKSMLSEGHGQAPRVRALLEGAHAAKQRDGFAGFGARAIGMEVTVRSEGQPGGDVTNMLGGVGDRCSLCAGTSTSLILASWQMPSSTTTTSRYARSPTARKPARSDTQCGSGRSSGSTILSCATSAGIGGFK
jgi:hypothetical protein